MKLHRTLSADGRAWVKEVWQAAQSLSLEASLLSALTSAVGIRFVQSYTASEGLAGEEVQQALSVVMKAGYATRTVLAGPTDQPSLDPSTLAPGTALDVEHDSAAGDQLIDSVASVASDDFQSVMTLPQEVWDAYVVLAASQLQRSLASGPLTWRELSTDRIEAMLCFGYVLRCLDEALEGDAR